MAYLSQNIGAANANATAVHTALFFFITVSSMFYASPLASVAYAVTLNSDIAIYTASITLSFFMAYTLPTITLHNEGSYHKDTFTVSIYDEAGKKLTEDKNVLASLNYVHKETAAFTLKTVLITEPAKDKDRGEYKGVMTYTVKYGKEDKEHQPKEDTP